MDSLRIDSLLENVRCNICGQSDFSVIRASNYAEFSSINQFIEIYRSSSDIRLFDQLVKCTKCQLVYLNPRISNEIAFKGYQEAIDYRHHYEDPYREKSFRRAMRKVEKILGGFCGSSAQRSLIDIGCAGGVFVKVALDLGFDATGLEPSRYLANYGKEKYQVSIMPKTIEESDLPHDSIDFVSMWDVLEHLPDPTSTLSLVDELLKKSGVLILNLPMVDTLPARILGKRWPFYLNVHTYYFDKRTIRLLLDKTGFSIIGMRRYWQSLSLGYVCERAGITLPQILRKLSSVSFRYYMGQRTIVAKKIT